MKENNNNISLNSDYEGLIITPKAIEELLRIKTQNKIPDEYGLRIGIKGGGCSGFAYSLGFDGKTYPTDHIFNYNGLKVLIDMKSFLYLTGATLDYKIGASGTGFVFDNPNVKITCGCGSAVKN
ncbi:MAG: iron-sulfur cluster assembly accessory protein [Ignavibacteria bacterium]|nr:iron-sulfur cluster assembly accessory protein [Ignavibacteria bacterium]